MNNLRLDESEVLNPNAGSEILCVMCFSIILHRTASQSMHLLFHLRVIVDTMNIAHFTSFFCLKMRNLAYH